MLPTDPESGPEMESRRRAGMPDGKGEGDDLEFRNGQEKTAGFTEEFGEALQTTFLSFRIR